MEIKFKKFLHTKILCRNEITDDKLTAEISNVKPWIDDFYKQYNLLITELNSCDKLNNQNYEKYSKFLNKKLTKWNKSK